MGVSRSYRGVVWCSGVPWEGGASQNPSGNPILVPTRFQYSQCERRRRKRENSSSLKSKLLDSPHLFLPTRLHGQLEPLLAGYHTSRNLKTVAERLLWAREGAMKASAYDINILRIYLHLHLTFAEMTCPNPGVPVSLTS